MKRSMEKALIRKDIRAITANRRLLAALWIVPLVMTILLPTILICVIAFAPLESDELQSLATLLPANLSAAELRGTVADLIFNSMLPLFFLMIPIMAASVMAASSFVGEKEKRTVALSHVPAADFLCKNSGRISAVHGRFPPFFRRHAFCGRGGKFLSHGALHPSQCQLDRAAPVGVSGRFPACNHLDRTGFGQSTDRRGSPATGCLSRASRNYSGSGSIFRAAAAQHMDSPDIRHSLCCCGSLDDAQIL